MIAAATVCALAAAVSARFAAGIFVAALSMSIAGAFYGQATCRDPVGYGGVGGTMAAWLTVFLMTADVELAAIFSTTSARGWANHETTSDFADSPILLGFIWGPLGAVGGVLVGIVVRGAVRRRTKDRSPVKL
jgi:hypothetical protein